jgi:hypothetical protein
MRDCGKFAPRKILSALSVIGFLFWFGCSPLQCDVVQSSYWKDKNDPAHPYKQTLRCFKADGTSEDLTVVASKMPLPVPKCEGGSK